MDVRQPMSAHVQRFGRRDDGTLYTLSWPASKTRQGTKSREVWQKRRSERYGDLMLAATLLVGTALA